MGESKFASCRHTKCVDINQVIVLTSALVMTVNGVTAALTTGLPMAK